jgi:hypothetical protein
MYSSFHKSSLGDIMKTWQPKLSSPGMLLNISMLKKNKIGTGQ